ncbi:MAG: F0F1 ATP synthase subunit B [Cyanobacteria bacterium SIG31]|nr:F0F1 ATP synthase subunit B [Cyanobacteria bacterium SIG31]
MSPAKGLKNMEFNGTFFATIITFVVFVFLMNKILYSPILNIMEERRKFVSDNYQSAKDNDAKIVAISDEKESLLNNAKDTAKDKYNEKIEDYKSKRADIVSEAQNSTKEDVEKSEIELSNLSNEVKEGLKGSMTDLANDIVEKVIGYRSEVQGFDNSKVDEILYH